jgi:cation diffusion facilitator family transporter
MDIKLKKKAALISLIIGFLMFFGKLGAYVLTGSAVILSDALESIVHIFATSFAFYSLRLSTKPPDTDHPYGHGKIEFFSAGFEGALIVVAAISIIYYAVNDLIYGSEISKLDIGAVIIAAASITNIFLGLYLIRTGKKTNSLVLIADGKHVLTDSYTSIGAFAALILVIITNITLFDPIIAIVLALNILWTGVHLMRESIGGLMNETSDKITKKIADEFEKERLKNPNWIDVHNLRYWRSGDKYMVDFHLIVPYYQTVNQGHQTMHRLDELLKKIFGTNQVESFIHLDPCNPKCCHICNMPDCKVRHEQKSKDVLWDSKKIVSPAYYDIDEIT